MSGYKNVFAVVTLDGEVLHYIAEDVIDAIQQQAENFGDSNVAGAFLCGNDYIILKGQNK